MKENLNSSGFDITIAVQCHNFQRRLCWMLSSLCEQRKNVRFVVDIAFLAGNGSPSTEAIISFFHDKIAIKASPFSDYQILSKRGLLRNHQLVSCQTEWLLFSDCDMVYHPKFMHYLSLELTRYHSNATYMVSSGRRTTPIDLANQLVDENTGPHPCMIKNAYNKAFTLALAPTYSIGAGYSQIINVKHAPHHNCYVNPKRNRDWDWGSRFQCARSDLQFRRSMVKHGGQLRRLPSWFRHNLVHLNHYRDRNFGRHIEDQR